MTLFPPVFFNLLLVIQSQVDSVKSRWECTKDILRRHFDWITQTTFGGGMGCMWPHFLAVGTAVCLGHTEGLPTQLMSV